MLIHNSDITVFEMNTFKIKQKMIQTFRAEIVAMLSAQKILKIKISSHNLMKFSF